MTKRLVPLLILICLLASCAPTQTVESTPLPTKTALVAQVTETLTPVGSGILPSSTEAAGAPTIEAPPSYEDFSTAGLSRPISFEELSNIKNKKAPVPAGWTELDVILFHAILETAVNRFSGNAGTGQTVTAYLCLRSDYQKHSIIVVRETSGSKEEYVWLDGSYNAYYEQTLPDRASSQYVFYQIPSGFSMKDCLCGYLNSEYLKFGFADSTNPNVLAYQHNPEIGVLVENTPNFEVKIAHIEQWISKVHDIYPMHIILITDKTVEESYLESNENHIEYVYLNPNFVSDSGQVAEDSISDAVLYSLYLARVKNYEDSATNADHSTPSFSEFVRLLADPNTPDVKKFAPILARDYDHPKQPPKMVEIVPGETTILFVNGRLDRFSKYLDHVRDVGGDVQETMGTFVRDGKLIIIIGLPPDSKLARTGAGMAIGQLITALSRLSDLEHQMNWLPKTDKFPFGKPVTDVYIEARLWGTWPDGPTRPGGPTVNVQPALWVEPLH